MDPTGEFLIDGDTKIYNDDDLSKIDNEGIKFMAECMKKTEIGQDLLNGLYNADYPISMTFHNGTYANTFPEENCS